MSRGARRRSSRGGKRRSVKPPAGSLQTNAGVDSQTIAGESSNRSRRRRRGGATRVGLGEILDTMAGRPSTVQTLPPDGVILEEVIANLESEYGSPVTPQEYRLIVKVASPEEAAAASSEEAARRQQEEAARPQGPRRRRRGNRRQSRKRASAATKTETPA